MKKLLLAASMLTALALPAKADIILENKLSGTGDNVVFNSLLGDLATGSFNGQHSGFVFFRDLSLNPLFTGAQSGNDIKIANTSNLNISLFTATDGLTQLYTSTDVFSLLGTGSVTAFVTAVDQFGNIEPIFNFNLGALDNNQPSNFTFSAINGELIQTIRLFDNGGEITDFRHYRVDVGTLAPVPGPIVGAGLPGLVAAAFGMLGFNRFRRRRQAAA